jgi:outer membrane protein TolC
MLTLGALLGARPARAEGLKLDEAIRQAIGNNERARIAALRVDIAAGQRERARAPFLPTVNFTGSSLVNAYADRTGSRWTHAAALTATQPLLAPSAIPLYAQAGYTLKAEQQNAIELQRTLAFDTAKAFVLALANEQVLTASEARLARAKADLANAEARAEAQLNSVNDATRARVDVAAAAQNVAQGVGSVQRSKTQLALLVGQEEVTGLEAPEALMQAATAFQGDTTQLISRAVETRPDIRALIQQHHAAQEFAREPHYRLLPTLALVGQIRANPDPLPTERWHDETLQLTLNWTIFDGGARYSDRKVRLAQAESVDLETRLAKREVGASVRAALVAIVAGRDAVRAAEQGVEAAKTNSEETAILYRQGLAKAIEVSDANSQRFNAEVGLAQARLSLVQSYLDLRQAMGVFPVDNVAPTVERRSSEEAQ